MATDLPAPDTWIGGRPEPSDHVEDDHLHDPSTEEPLQQRRSSSHGQVERALASAHRAHLDGDWAALGVSGRAPYLLRLAAELDRLVDDIAVLDALNSGVPVATTRMFAGSLGDTVRDVVELATSAGERTSLPADQGPVELLRVPWGPTVVLTPWNAPSALAVKKSAVALVAGAPVVLKPSPAAPWSAELLLGATRAAGLPDDVLGLVLGGGEVGAQLCSDPRVRAITMTGSTPTGREIARVAAPLFTRLRLELGSNNPVLVRADADVATTGRQLYDGMTKLNGQWCEAPRNVYVHHEVAGPLHEVLGELVSGAALGPSLDEDTVIGPQAFRARRDELVGQRERWRAAGHRVVHGVEPDRGWYVAPTLVHGDDLAVEDEVFGPLLTLETVSSDEEAVARANRTAGGLAGYVFSEDRDLALRLGARLLAGEVKVNGTSVLDMAPGSAQSFFGSSGLGGHGDADVLDFHWGKRVVGVDLVGAPI